MTWLLVLSRQARDDTAMAKAAGNLIAFRVSSRAGDASVFKQAAAALGDGQTTRPYASPKSSRSEGRMLVVVAAVILCPAMLATVGLRLTHREPAPRVQRAPLVTDFSVRVAGSASTARSDGGRFVMATIPLTGGARADAKMRKVLSSGKSLMMEAKRNAVTAASACLGRKVKASIGSGDTVGASGGLMFAVAVVDEMTPGDLTGGRLVAGTGAIASDGRVGSVLKITQKVKLAERAGADLFISPATQAAEAKGAAKSIRIVGVKHLSEALIALGSHCR